jgi:purine-binding chemotaxis protein CheW
MSHRTEPATANSDVQMQGKTSAEDASIEFLTFILGSETYGVDILKVREIRAWESATRVPNTPDYLVGILNLRGAIVPVLDLRLRFGLEAIDYQDRTVVIVIAVESGDHTRVVGMVADGVADVVELERTQVKPTPSSQGRIDSDFITGLAQVDERVIMLIEHDRLFTELWDAGVDDASQSTALPER